MRQPSPWTGLSPLKVVGGTLRTSEHPGAEENIVILNRPKVLFWQLLPFQSRLKIKRLAVLCFNFPGWKTHQQSPPMGLGQFLRQFGDALVIGW